MIIRIGFFLIKGKSLHSALHAMHLPTALNCICSQPSLTLFSCYLQLDVKMIAGCCDYYYVVGNNIIIITYAKVLMALLNNNPRTDPTVIIEREEHI